MKTNKSRRWIKRTLAIVGSLIFALTIALGAAAYLGAGGNTTIAADLVKNVLGGTNGYKFYTNSSFLQTGLAFTAENCFDEQMGVYRTVDIAYALYVPKDYDPTSNYALVTVNNPATGAGAHPYESLIMSHSPAYFASDEAQQLVKDTHGLDGMIVVVPTITERVGDNSASPAEFPALVKLWDYLQEEYSIDENHIYGVGQSVGGMMLLETNTKRDNYFAGILLYDDQWGQNYYKDEVFARDMSISYATETAENTPRHYPATNSIEWDYHWGDNGEKVYQGHDENNYYYLISDDNVMITNSSNNLLSGGVWQEQNFLYQDLVGYEIPRLAYIDPQADKAVQEQMIADYLAQPNMHNGNDMGIYWVTFEGGTSMTTPVWSRSLDVTYEWLLSQTRESEMVRPKLDLNKPFEGMVIQTEERLMPNFHNPDTEEQIYYLTGKAGSGTQFYNTSWLNLQVTTDTNLALADRIPGWLPGNMTHPVKMANIESATTINAGGRLIAVAIEYSEDMENAIIHRKGDHVLDSKGISRSDDFVALDTYDFYDISGEKIDGKITNIYINNSPNTVPDAKHGSGAGQYVIVEIETTWSGESVGIIQRATVRTGDAIVAANSKIWR